MNDEAERRALFEKMSDKLELLRGYFNQLDLKLKQPRDEAGDEPTKIDMELASYNAAAHFNEDMFAAKVAFAIILNFPSYSLSEKREQGERWSALQWGYARMGDVFATRIPAELTLATAKANADAEAYVSSYNVAMGALRSEAGEAPILAIYSHMLSYPLYLPSYPMGRLIELQLEEHLRGKNLAGEVLRIYRLGRLTPQLWMKRATSGEVSVEPALKAAAEAVKQLSAT